MDGKIFCFGEILLRLSPEANGGWIGKRSIATHIGGAEANVARALANWNVPVKYGTAMPDNYIGHDIEAYLEKRGVDTSAVHWSGNRVGIYFMQQGTDLKHAGVFYDRAYSSFYDLKPGMIDWDEALKDVSWFHYSAISPALNANVTAVCEEALKAASAKGITISVDLNYRAKLWQWGKKPAEVMPQLAQYCDVIMGNIWAAQSLLGIPINEELVAKHSKENYLVHAQQTVNAIRKKFPKCSTVANTFRFDTADGIQYYTTLHNGDGAFSSIEFTGSNIADRAGSGDCFMGGLIYGMYHTLPPQETLNFATAAAFGKFSEIGDATQQTIGDVKKTLKNYEQKATIL